jgi:hypothetical protein
MRHNKRQMPGCGIERGYEGYRLAGDRLSRAYGYVLPEVSGRFNESEGVKRVTRRAAGG